MSKISNISSNTLHFPVRSSLNQLLGEYNWSSKGPDSPDSSLPKHPKHRWQQWPFSFGAATVYPSDFHSAIQLDILNPLKPQRSKVNLWNESFWSSQWSPVELCTSQSLRGQFFPLTRHQQTCKTKIVQPCRICLFVLRLHEGYSLEGVLHGTHWNEIFEL